MGDEHKGISHGENGSFADAARDAVRNFEETIGGPPKEPVTLQVAEMYVEVRNPIHEWIVVLKQTP